MEKTYSVIITYYRAGQTIDDMRVRDAFSITTSETLEELQERLELEAYKSFETYTNVWVRLI